jgi:membrane-associated phospholipid phosphatase
MFAWALLVAFSRGYLGLHYFTDIVVGAVLGFAVSYVITRVALRRDEELARFVDHPLTFVRSLLRSSQRRSQ